MSVRLSGPVDTAVFNASSLSGNSIGGYYNNDVGEFVATTEGIIALCEGLKGSAVTSLECAAAPMQVFAFLSAPLDTWPSPLTVCSTTRLAMVPTPSCLLPPRCRR